MIRKIFYSRLIRKFCFLSFHFYRQVIKKWNSKLSVCVILDLWLIKVKKIDKIALNVNPKVLIFFLLLHENMCCGYLLEVPHRGPSNEYPQPVRHF